jgi:Uma2 family endonuclease
VAAALPWGRDLTVDDLEPDVVVIEQNEATRTRLTGTPSLVVEVLSSSTRRQDLGSKRLAYAGYGVPAYWVVDPEPPVTLVAFRLEGDAYVEDAVVAGEEAYEAKWPFTLTVVPARLAGL